jgi:glycerophosphoryl diester phosphodiesterase
LREPTGRPAPATYLRVTVRVVLIAALLACSSSVPSPAPPDPPTGPVALPIVRPRIVAHRGASAEAPENTMSAFRRAWELGVECVELDVHVTRDGETVVIHDDTTKRVGGRDREVAAQTLAELRELDVGGWKSPRFANERIPTIGDVLAALPSGRAVFVEIKTGPGTAKTIAKAIAAADPRPHGGTVLLQGIEPDALAALAAELPWAPAYWTPFPPMEEGPDPEHPRIYPYPRELIAEAKRRGFAGLALLKEAVTDELLADARAAGLSMDVWTANTAADIATWQAKGVRWIETDFPGLAQSSSER